MAMEITQRPASERDEQFAESRKLEKAIRKYREVLGYGE